MQIFEYDLSISSPTSFICLQTRIDVLSSELIVDITQEYMHTLFVTSSNYFESLPDILYKWTQQHNFFDNADDGSADGFLDLGECDKHTL